MAAKLFLCRIFINLQIILQIISITFARFPFEYDPERDCYIQRVHEYVSLDERPYVALYENLDGSGRNGSFNDLEVVEDLTEFLLKVHFSQAKLLCLNSLWLLYSDRRFNEDVSGTGSVWFATGYHCFDLTKSNIASIQRFAVHPQWNPEEISFFTKPLFQGQMNQFGRYNELIYHSSSSSSSGGEDKRGIFFKSAIIAGSTSWLMGFKKPGEPKFGQSYYHCFTPVPKENVEYSSSQNECRSSTEANDIYQMKKIFRVCGQISHLPGFYKGETGQKGGGGQETSEKMFFAFPDFDNSIFKSEFHTELDLEQTNNDYVIRYGSDEEMNLNEKGSRTVNQVKSPLINVHDRPDWGSLFICILEDTSSISAPNGLFWDGGAPEECEPEWCNSLPKFMQPQGQINLTKCFPYGLAFKLEELNNYKPEFCLNEAFTTDGSRGFVNGIPSEPRVSPAESVDHIDITNEQTLNEEMIQINIKRQKSFSDLLDLLKQRIEFDLELEKTEYLRNNPTFSHEREKKMETVVHEEKDDSSRKESGVKDWRKHTLDLMLDISVKKCTQRWLPPDFLLLLRKLSLFFFGKVESGRLRKRTKIEKITKNDSDTSSSFIKLGTRRKDASSPLLGEAQLQKTKSSGSNSSESRDDDDAQVNQRKYSRILLSHLPLWYQVEEMLSNCLGGMVNSQPIKLIGGLDEPNVVEYYESSTYTDGHSTESESQLKFLRPLKKYATTLEEMLSQHEDPVVELLWHIHSVVYASCITNNNFNAELLIFAKFSTGFQKLFLRPVATFWKNMDQGLYLQYKESVYDHLFSGYNLTLMLHNVEACSQALQLDGNIEELRRP